MERREILKENILVKYQSVLMDYLQDKNTDEDIKFFHKISRFEKQILIDEMTDFALKLKGETFYKLKELYYELNFHVETFRKLKSHHWHKKIKAFKELYALNITEKNDVLLKYVNSKNDILRIEAQIALVDLSKEDPTADAFDFLSNLKVPFSLWEQITLHQIMVQRDIRIPDFGEWLLSENDSVCMFCLRMVREYNQIQNAEKIRMLAFHNNDDVRKLAYEVMGDLKLTDVISAIKKNYKNETRDNCLEMIKSIGKVSDSSFIKFLQIIIDKEEDADILIEAVKAIHSMGEIGDLTLKKMMASEYKNYNIIIKHVLDHRIN
jgi:hypothetical protein